MTTRNLQIFVKVADCGKMSEAARELYISQSSVSQAIADIERSYDIRLFERLGKRLYLTPVGEELLTYARHAVDLQTSMDEWLRQAASIKTLRIGATVTVGSTVLSSILKELQIKHPKTQVQVLVDNTHVLEEMLLRSELDVVLAEGRISHPDLYVEQAMQDELAVAVGRAHRFFGKDSIQVSDLHGERFVLREKGSGTREQTEEILKRFHVPYEVCWQCTNTEAIKMAVCNGHGITIISRRLLKNDIEDGYLWGLPINGLDLNRTFNLVWHKNKVVTDVLQGFLDCTRAYGKAADAALIK